MKTRLKVIILCGIVLALLTASCSVIPRKNIPDANNNADPAPSPTDSQVGIM